MPELRCVFCGRPARSPTEHAEPERDLGHRPGVIKEPDERRDLADRRAMRRGRIAIADIASQRLRCGRRSE